MSKITINPTQQITARVPMTLIERVNKYMEKHKEVTLVGMVIEGLDLVMTNREGKS